MNGKSRIAGCRRSTQSFILTYSPGLSVVTFDSPGMSAEGTFISAVRVTTPSRDGVGGAVKWGRRRQELKKKDRKKKILGRTLCQWTEKTMMKNSVGGRADG